MAIPSISDPKNSAQVMTTVNQLVRQFDNTGSFNLAASVTATTVTNPKVNPMSKITLVPRSAASGSSGWFLQSVGNGSFVVGHASATTTRTFDYVIHGV